jgi:hypothetical protein
VTYPCPFCTETRASATTGCPSCGRGPDPDALEVIRLDGVIAALTGQLITARLAAQHIEGELTRAWAWRNAAAAKVRHAVAHSTAAVRDVPRPTATGPVSGPPREKHPVPPSRETSTKWVQNALFLLGGLLLAVAAIVFTAVAWAQFGVGGRAALLAAFTGAALAVPPLARRSGLTATAETFAAVGLLLILLDGYAAWYVNLFGVTGTSPWGYAAAAGAVTAAVAAGYAHLTGLAGPRFAALLIAQPVLPLFLVPAHPPTVGWAYAYTAVALLDLTVLVLARPMLARPVAVRIVAGALAAVAVLTAAALATAALTAATTPAPAALAGGALVLAALLPLAAAIRLRQPAAQSAFAGALVVTVAASAARVAVLLAPAHPLLPAALALLAVAVFAATARFVWLDRVVAQGVQIGAATALLPAVLIAVAEAAQAAARTLATARPVLAAPLSAIVPGDGAGDGTGPHLPLVLAVLAIAVAATVPAAGRRLTVLVAGALALLAFPAALHLPWWSGPIFDLAGVAAALFLAARYAAPPAAARAAGSRSAPAAVFNYGSQILVALLLTAHGVAAGFGTAAVAAATLAAVAALGLGLAARTRRGPRRLDLAGPGLLVALLTWPAVAWATTAALTSSAATQSRIALAAALLPAVVVHVLGRRLRDLRPFALAAALIPVVLAPLWGFAAGDPAGVYAALALVALATLAADPAAWSAAVLPAATLLIATAVPLSRVLFAPYANLADVWSGDRTTWPVPATAPIAVLLATAAAALAAEIRGHRRRAVEIALPMLAVTTALALAAAHAPWPYLPAAELLLGLAGLLAAALQHPLPAPTPHKASGRTPYVISVLLAGAGLAGALPTRPATLAALGAVLITGAVAGATGRALPARLTGWLAAVAAALGIVLTPDLARTTTTFLVLAVAAATLALSWLRPSRPAESRPIEAAAHATAVLALLLAAPHLHTTAAICLLWGLALGLRALRPDGRDAYLLAAATAELAGWIQLMVIAHLGTLEAYSIPAAAVALLAGLLTRRRMAGLSSWSAYGPALAAALIPSLASILFTDGHYPRRLLLGLAALAVLLTGARARLQAPVVLGGTALALVALHELAQVWDLVPRWLPLAAAGLLLVLLATTLERRRRDLDRIRTALTRMT